MITIAITGMGSQHIAKVAAQTGGSGVTVMTTSDIEAATAVKTGDADFYIGACQTGAGGALGVATAILGAHNVMRLSGGESARDDAAVRDALGRGVRAFGLAHTHIDSIVPALVLAIVATAGAGQD